MERPRRRGHCDGANSTLSASANAPFNPYENGKINATMYGRAFGTLLMHSALGNILRCDLLSPGMAYVPKARNLGFLQVSGVLKFP